MCVFKNHWSAEKTCYKMIFWPEHAEDIMQLCLFVKSNIWVCFWLICKRNIKKVMIPNYCLFVYIFLFYSVIKRYAHCCFSIDKIKKKKKKPASYIAVFWMYYWKHTWYFFNLKVRLLYLCDWESNGPISRSIWEDSGPSSICMQKSIPSDRKWNRSLDSIDVNIKILLLFELVKYLSCKYYHFI